MSEVYINLPFTEKEICDLRSGDKIYISGIIYTARDAAHKRMVQQLDNNESLPINLKNQVIYYVGPTPAVPGKVIGSAGPTTSSRMDAYTPDLLEMGLKCMIGKGYRNKTVVDAISKNKAVYCAAIGGTGALLSKTIQSSEVVAYDDLGTEAIHKLEVIDFPCIVINDTEGNDWYVESQKEYRK